MIEPMGEPRKIEIQWSGSTVAFFAVHALALLAFVVPFSWSMVGLCLGLYALRMFGITGGYHRYFSHRSYKTSRFFQAVLAVFGLLAHQKGPLWWGAHHRHHHRHSDRHGDVHSPGLEGFLWAHVGWVLVDDYRETEYERIADFTKYPELRWLNEHHWVPGVVLGAIVFFVGGFSALVWGVFVSLVLTWHATFAINSFTHMFGRRRFMTKDDSRNSLILALLTMGEGWHNNHHYFKASTRQGFYWYEIDPTYYVLRTLSLFGIVWDLKEPPRKVLEDLQSIDGESGLRDPLKRADHALLGRKASEADEKTKAA